MFSRLVGAVLAALVLASCTIVSLSGPSAPPQTQPAVTAPSASQLQTSAAPRSEPPNESFAPADLSKRPLVWFAPLPPLPGRTGSTDFMDQFSTDAPSSTAAGYIDVYKLYGEWVGDASPTDLRTAIDDISRRGMVLAMEAGPLTAPANCGQGVESFPGKAAGLDLARRIASAGGRLAVLALDEPYYFGHVYDGPQACHLDVGDIAAQVDDFVTAMRSYFPEMLVGDIEPDPAPVTAADLGDWLAAYQQAAGEPFAFLHLDADWGRPGWDGLAHDVQAQAAAHGVPFGLIYNGGTAPNRAQWVQVAGSRVAAFESSGAPLDHVIFQSWDVQPDQILPDTDPSTFSGFIATYFTDHSTLGHPVGGSGANLALGQHATASASIAGSPPGAAVDGDYDTLWSAGSGPVQWIDVDLGGAHDVASIGLTVSQYPDGVTDHRVYGRTKSGKLVLLHEFDGPTTDGQVLSYTPPQPWTDLTAIRVETRSSPSWVAWREIEVLAP